MVKIDNCAGDYFEYPGNNNLTALHSIKKCKLSKQTLYWDRGGMIQDTRWDCNKNSACRGC